MDLPYGTHTLKSSSNKSKQFKTGLPDLCRESNYKKCSISKVKKDIVHWDDLATRRKVASLTNFHQAIGGHLAIPARNILRPVQRSTRLTSPTTNNFTPIQASKDCYKQSFLPRTVIDWNQLPKSITTIVDKQQFKTAINQHFRIQDQEEIKS